MRVFETLPSASPRIGFYRTVSSWKDAILLEFGPEGTMHYAQGTIKGDTGNLYTTGMKEPQIIFGDTQNLELAIRELDRDQKPEMLFVASSPVSEIIGTDLNFLCRKLQPDIQAQLIVWDQVPVEGTEAIGSRSAYEKAADFLSKSTLSCTAEPKDGFVVLGLGEADWNGIADLYEIRRMMDTYFNIPCLNDKDGRYRLDTLRTARWILAATPEAVPLAAAAQELWGTPWHVGFPLGIANCQKMLNAFETATGILRNQNWEAELAETQKAVSSFRQSIRSMPKRRFYVDSREDRQSDWLDFLSNELGVTVSVPSPGTHALSVDGSLSYHSEIQKGDILLASGMLCSLYSNHPSLCIEYPVTNQKQFSAYAPHTGIRGIQNLLTLLHSLLLQNFS